FGEVGDCGINLEGHFSYPWKRIISFCISVETTRLWESNYSEYQTELFDKIRGLKEDILTPLGYRLISKKLNEEGYLTPEGNRFTNSHVFSIYQKGLKRLERVNRPDIIEVNEFDFEYFKSFRKFLKTLEQHLGKKIKKFSFHKYP
ncbi:MAG: hypothetical protein HWE07_02655, partial [Cytophagia bacterium]|nr:hypothetical protein [Cytophagia bacterium]